MLDKGQCVRLRALFADLGISASVGFKTEFKSDLAQFGKLLELTAEQISRAVDEMLSDSLQIVFQSYDKLFDLFGSIGRA